MHIFRVKNLEVWIGEKKILNHLNLSVQSGTLCAILAPNGNGKTTLLRTIIGVNSIKSGEILFDNEDLSKFTVLQRSKIVALLPQDFQCAFDYSVLDFILLGGINQMHFAQLPQKQLVNKAKEILMELGILSLQNQGIFSLSGGQRQMVLLARSLLQDAKVLLLDEPTAWLDLKNQILFFKILKKQVLKKQLCVLMNIHDPNLVCQYADYIFLIKNGMNLYQGGVAEVMCADKLTELYDIPIRTVTIRDRNFIIF